MNERLNIPDKIAVGFKKSESRLSYVTWINSKGKIQKQTSWDKWRNANIPSLELENKPTSGFTILSDITTKFYYHGGTHELCHVLDPRGFEFELDLRNLLFVLKHTTSNHLELTGDFVYSWSGSNLVLLPCESNEYKMSKALQENKRRYTVKDLIPGHSYRSIHSDRLIYIGQENIYQATVRYDIVEDCEYFSTARTLGSVFYDPISSQAVIITSGLGKEIDYELPEDTWMSEKEIQEWIVKNYPNIPYLSSPGTVTSLEIKEFPVISSTSCLNAAEYWKYYLGPDSIGVDLVNLSVSTTPAILTNYGLVRGKSGGFILFDTCRPTGNYSLERVGTDINLLYRRSEKLCSVSEKDPDCLEKLKKAVSDNINKFDIFIRALYRIGKTDNNYTLTPLYNRVQAYTIDDIIDGVCTEVPFWNPNGRADIEIPLQSSSSTTLGGLIICNERGEEMHIFKYKTSWEAGVESVIKISL